MNSNMNFGSPGFNYLGDNAELERLFWDIPRLSWQVYPYEVVRIKGINEKYYGNLNNSLAYLTNEIPLKYTIDRKGEQVILSNGKYQTEEVKVPSGSKYVLSGENLMLPYKYQPTEEGFGFVSTITGLFGYFIPSDYLYKVPLIALAISRKKLRNYKCIEVKLFHYGKVYLQVIPYSIGKQYSHTMIQCAREYSPDLLQNEFNQTLLHWVNLGLVMSQQTLEPSEYEEDIEEVPLVRKANEYYANNGY